MSHAQEAQQDPNQPELWLLSPDELARLPEDQLLESTNGTKRYLAELRDAHGELRPQHMELRFGHTPWGIRSDSQPTIQRQLGDRD